MRACTCIIAAVLPAGCGNEPSALTIAINVGVEGDALKAAAAARWTHAMRAESLIEWCFALPLPDRPESRCD
jgi:hypothetical protein